MDDRSAGYIFYAASAPALALFAMCASVLEVPTTLVDVLPTVEPPSHT